SIAELKSDELVKLELFLPQQSLDAYQNQKPLQLEAKVAWVQPAKNIGDSNIYGLQFSKLTAAQETALRACLAFYHRPVEFQ
ncbi:MAG: PilZ domain-containing protein, partial [Aquaspirillum sp.]